MSIDTVIITQNPVTNWEIFSESLVPLAARRGFSQERFSHRRMGGFWSAAFRYHDDPISLREFFINGLGRDVKFYNDRGGIDFEGYINSMRLVGAGNAILAMSLDSVYSQVLCRYKNDAGSTVRSATATDATAQGRYGIKQFILSGGEIEGSTIADGLAQQVLKRRHKPKPVPESLRIGLRSTPMQPHLEIECMGYIHTLRWRVYNQTASTGTQSADLEMADIIASVGQFIASTKFEHNTTGVTKEYDSDRWALDICFDIARLGDVYNEPWVLQMLADRLLVYRPAMSAVEITL